MCRNVRHHYIENELNEVNLNFNRAKMKQIDKDVIPFLRKDRQDVEGPMFEIETSVEKRKLRALIACWKAITHEKDGKYTSRGIKQKRADVADIRGEQDVIKLVTK